MRMRIGCGYAALGQGEIGYTQMGSQRLRIPAYINPRSHPMRGERQTGNAGTKSLNHGKHGRTRKNRVN
jgi:hypothetical protein